MEWSSSLCTFLSTSTFLFHPSVDSLVSRKKCGPSLAIWICDKNSSSESGDGVFTTAGCTSLAWFLTCVCKFAHCLHRATVPLLSLLIFCSLSVLADGKGAMTLEEPCLDTICAALALRARRHMMALTSVRRPQQQTGVQTCMYTTHTHTCSH